MFPYLKNWLTGFKNHISTRVFNNKMNNHADNILFVLTVTVKGFINARNGVIRRRKLNR